MANSISSIGSSTSLQRGQSAVQTSNLRTNATVLNATGNAQKASGVNSRVALATPAGGNSKTKVPRGSLVDVLA